MNETKLKFHQALLALSKTYSFKEMTITQLAQEASVSRKSFYRHYQTKDNLLNSFLETLAEELLMKLRKAFQVNSTNQVEHAVKAYLAYWKAHQHCLKFVIDNHLQYELNNVLLAVMTNLFQEETTLFPQLKIQQEYSYLLVYVQGGINSILFHWYEEGMTKSIDKLSKKIVSLNSLNVISNELHS